MARIFITGSADGLGQLAAKQLISEGHRVVLHARNEVRALQALEHAVGAESIVTGDLSSIAETKKIAADINTMGVFDAIIHNAGVYNIPAASKGKEGIPTLFAVNSLAPYILTALITAPKRIIYMSSGMHMQGKNIDQPDMHFSYSDTKLHDVILCMAAAARWKTAFINAVNPGWVPTRMGGAGAPDNLEQGYATQVWLATSKDATAAVSGRYFHHKKQQRCSSEANNAAVQERFLSFCEKCSEVQFPGS